jgi:hypothetical protein
MTHLTKCLMFSSFSKAPRSSNQMGHEKCRSVTCRGAENEAPAGRPNSAGALSCVGATPVCMPHTNGTHYGIFRWRSMCAHARYDMSLASVGRSRHIFFSRRIPDLCYMCAVTCQ